MKTLTSILLLAATCAYAGDWFIAPTTSLVIPEKSNTVYHGFSGQTGYNDGYAVGLNLGYDFGNSATDMLRSGRSVAISNARFPEGIKKSGFRLYGSYDYSEYRSKQTTLLTPYGEITQGNGDLFKEHTVMFNADYEFQKLIFGLHPYVGGGAGASFNSTTAAVGEIRCGLEKNICGLDFTAGYSRRWVDGQERWGHKADGSYSITLDAPNLSLITLAISKRW